MDAGLIGTIVSGATSLATSFVAFGGQVYAVDHTKAPEADQFTYNIVLPQQQSQSSISTEAIILIVVVIVLLIIGGIAAYKFM